MSSIAINAVRHCSILLWTWGNYNDGKLIYLKANLFTLLEHRHHPHPTVFHLDETVCLDAVVVSV